MHELSIAEDLIHELEAIARREHAARVTEVHLRIGGLSGVDPEALKFAFPMAAEGTPIANAELIVDFSPARLTCSTCGKSEPMETPLIQCPSCGSTAVEVEGSRDLLIQSVAIEESSQP